MTYAQKMEDVRRASFEEGYKESIQKGIKGIIAIVKELGQSKEFMLEALVREYSLSREEARQMLDRYW